MNRIQLFIGILLVVMSVRTHAQVDSAIAKYAANLEKMPDKLIQQLDTKYSKIDNKIESSSTKMLKKMQRQEEKLKTKLAKLDSNKAKELFANSQQYYAKLNDQLKNKTAKAQQLNQYIPGLDSLSTATQFLQNAGSKMQGFKPEKLLQLKQLSGVLNSTQSSIQNATDIRKLLSERKQQLQQALKQYDLGKQLKSMNKEIYYYQEQLKEYKTLLQDQQKLEQKALAYVRELPAFKEFMHKNSLLAKLFPMPANYGTAQALAGLQTRASIQADLAQRMTGTGGVNPQQYMQQQMQAGQQQLSQLKDKVNKLGGSDASIEMPSFKPNTQKTKSFWKRLEYGLNIQSQKTNSLLPTTTDIGLTAGYKLNDKSTIGIGSSYKLGWGNSIREIHLTNQGIGLRSFLDIKLKGSFWITGGYEQNYLPKLGEKLDALAIPSIRSNSWQESGLIGLTKKYKIGKKTNNLQLLWDFLSYQQVPRTQAIKFRIGYTF